jgi:hypothetical protein
MSKLFTALRATAVYALRATHDHVRHTVEQQQQEKQHWTHCALQY